MAPTQKFLPEEMRKFLIFVTYLMLMKWHSKFKRQDGTLNVTWQLRDQLVDHFQKNGWEHYPTLSRWKVGPASNQFKDYMLVGSGHIGTPIGKLSIFYALEKDDCE